MATQFITSLSKDPLALSETQQSRLLSNDLSGAGDECCVDLKWGFFFDGTNNNLYDDKPSLTHSNVARLYDVFPADSSTPENLKRYAAGVGTPFYDEVGDQGKGLHQKAGLAAGWGGEARINWALLKLCDNLHAYFEGIDFGQALGQPDPKTVKRMSTDMKIDLLELKKLDGDEVELLREVGTLSSIRTLTYTHSATPNDFMRRVVLKERREALKPKVDAWQQSRKPKVRSIHLSVFGFSRGAAEARVFCNWLDDALAADSTLCGIPVEVDFLGIFDTVASVGLANSTLVFDGHGGWGREEDLRVPSRVKRCVHMVASHEVRASFPLDGYRGDCRSWLQLVCPGVHSDLGGGYLPGEQGKGFVGGQRQDSAKLSQIPLVQMYKEAVAAGVPLDVMSARIPQSYRDAFEIDDGLWKSYAGYLDAMGGTKYGGLEDLMHEGYAAYLRWRKLRLGAEQPNGMTHQSFVDRARKQNIQDVADMLTANQELAEEEKALLAYEQDPALRQPGNLQQRVADLIDHVARTYTPFLPVRDAAVNAILSEKMEAWRQVKPYWNEPEPLDPRIVSFFDDYVHDSRAWFKPMSDSASDAAWIIDQTERMQKLDAQDKEYRKWASDKREYERLAIEGNWLQRIGASQALAAMNQSPQSWPDPVTGEDKTVLDAWRANPKNLPLEESGREPGWLFGFLRWRTIYIDRASWAQRTANAVKVYIDGQKKAIEKTADDMIDKAARKAGEVIEDAFDDAVDAAGRYIKDRIKDVIPTGLPRL